MNDKEVVDAFVEHLRSKGHPGIRVESRPDEENRSSSDIDAIAGPFAIEHTSIDTIQNQRRDSDWFVKAVGGLEKELPPPPFGLRITVEYDAVAKGQDWAAIRTALKAWVSIEAGKLRDGRHGVGPLPGIPFRLRVRKDSDLRPCILFSRYDPGSASALGETITRRIRNAVDRKMGKLRLYAAIKTTILLLENDDAALMNTTKMLGAISDALPRGFPLGLDQLWYADTSGLGEVEFHEWRP